MTPESDLWRDDLAWLVASSEGALGLHGAALEPSGTRDPSDTWPDHLAHIRRIPTTRRASRLLDRWRQLERVHQRVLSSHYWRERPKHQGNPEAWPRGADRLGDCCAVALWLAREAGALDALLDALTRLKDGNAGKAGANRALVSSWRHKAETAVRAAHAAWDAIGMGEAREWVG